jgi:hypothetical protein
MSQESEQFSPIFQIDVSATSGKEEGVADSDGNELNQLLRQLVIGQERQNELLEELVDQMSATQRQRSAELAQWKRTNPKLARDCRVAAEMLSEVQTEFLTTMTEEVREHRDSLLEGEFMLNELVDRFGPRLAHMNGMLQVLSQLSSAHNSSQA